MGLFTHHKSDSNVIDSGCGWATIGSGVDSNHVMHVTSSGYLQPAVELRIHRFFTALVVGFAIMFVRFFLNGSGGDIDTFWMLSQYDNKTLNIVLVCAACAIWYVAIHFFVGQKAYMFGSKLWAVYNSTMMLIYFVIVGCVTVVYLGVAITGLVDWVSSLWRNR